MKLKRSSTRLMAVGIAAFLSAAAAPESKKDERVLEAIQRSKTTNITYALYIWNSISTEGQPSRGEWAAEFHSGNMHRVETPRDRVIADCSTGVGAALSLETGTITKTAVTADYACGINTARKFLAAEWLGKIQTKFGEADRIQLTDKDHIRTYDISVEGVILHTVYAVNGPDHPTILEAETVALLPTLPSSAMFDERSLQNGFVAENFKIPPLDRQ